MLSSLCCVLSKSGLTLSASLVLRDSLEDLRESLMDLSCGPTLSDVATEPREGGVLSTASESCDLSETLELLLFSDLADL